MILFVLICIIIGLVFSLFDWYRWYGTESKLRRKNIFEEFAYFKKRGFNPKSLFSRYNYIESKMASKLLAEIENEIIALEEMMAKYDQLETNFEKIVFANKDLIEEIDLKKEIAFYRTKFSEAKEDFNHNTFKDLEEMISSFIDKIDKIKKYQSEGFG